MPIRSHLLAPLTTGAMPSVNGRTTTIRSAADTAIIGAASARHQSVGARAQSNMTASPIATPAPWRVR